MAGAPGKDHIQNVFLFQQPFKGRCEGFGCRRLDNGLTGSRCDLAGDPTARRPAVEELAGFAVPHQMHDGGASLSESLKKFLGLLDRGAKILQLQRPVAEFDLKSNEY
jgi:hypothetical protein